MGFLILILVGLIAGTIAKMLMPGKDPGGFIITILLGIGGAYLGSYLSAFIPFVSGEFGQLTFGSIISAVVGSLVLLILYRLMRGKR